MNRRPGDVRALELVLAQLVNVAAADVLDRLGVQLLVCADDPDIAPSEHRAYARAHALLNGRRAEVAIVQQRPRSLTIVRNDGETS